MGTPDTVTISELKRLIVELRDHSPDTKIRFRVLGKMWEKNFLQIVHTTTDNAVIVQDIANVQNNKTFTTSNHDSPIVQCMFHFGQRDRIKDNQSV